MGKGRVPCSVASCLGTRQKMGGHVCLHLCEERKTMHCILYSETENTERGANACCASSEPPPSNAMAHSFSHSHPSLEESSHERTREGFPPCGSVRPDVTYRTQTPVSSPWSLVPHIQAPDVKLSLLEHKHERETFA